MIIKLVEKTLRVGIVARQSQPIFLPRWSRRDARSMRPFKVNGKQIHAVIRTDARTVRPYMHSSSSPSSRFHTLIRPVWECRDAWFVRPLKVNDKQMYAVIGTDARTVRPYMHSSSSFSPPSYVLIRLMWVCRDARFVRPLKVNGKQIHAVIGTDARAVRPYMHSNSSPSPPFYALIPLMWVCRDARFVRPLHVNEIANARTVYPYMPYNNQLVDSFTAHLSTVMWTDARAVRPYLHSY